MKIWTGDETGLVKGVHVEGRKVVQKWRQQSREEEVQHMCWGIGASADECESTIVLALKSRKVQAIGTSTGSVVWEHDGFDTDFVGLDTAGAHIATCTANGTVQYRKFADAAKKPVYELEHGADIYRMRTCPELGSVYAVGGKGQGRDLKVFDIARKEPVFKAKNVSNDRVDLAVPVWIHDLAFVPGSAATKLVTVTAHRHVRIYDTKAKKKPVASIEFGERPIRSVAVTPCGQFAVIGNAVGEMRKVDIRTGQICGGFKGPAGSLRSIVCHPSLPLVASCSLDRHAYVHRLDGAMEAKIYLKQRLNAVLFASEGRVALAQGHGEGEEREGEAGDALSDSGDNGDNDDDVWNAMETVGDKVS